MRAALLLLLLSPGMPNDPDRYDRFHDRVLPVLQTRCVSCHGPDKQKGGLRLDSRAALLKGGDTGPAAMPGDPAKSLLLQAVTQKHPELKMPPKEKLAAEQVDALALWIKEGAVWPDPVSVLFEDEAPALHEGDGTARLSKSDRHSGTSSLVVAPQKLAAAIPGWRYPVAEHPKAGEVRYLRFAWKKRGPGAILFEVAHDGRWRGQNEANGAWVAGKNTTGWGAFPVSDSAPAEWTVVTRDLWADRGSWKTFVITGMCLTAVDGGEALLDGVIVGPTLESLDAYRPGRGHSPATARIGDAWSDPRNPIVRIFGGKRLDLWSLRPIASAPFPGIDALLLAELRKKGLGFSPEADRRTLIRRVTYDLLGLPPTPEEVDAFVADGNYERLVERLLADPRHGERWARHWLDVVRYSDTQGFERDELQPQIWRYRDYVIRSLNEDKPFDRFIREQLAGDEMLQGAPRNAEEIDALVATGYLRMGPYDSTGSIFEENAKNRNELMTDLANTTGSAFLGMSMACANCHDHKHDPISQADHFRLRAFFAAVKRQDDTLIDLAPVQERVRAVDAEVKALEARRKAILDPARKAIDEARRAEFPEEIRALLAKEKPSKEEQEKLKPFRKKLEIAEDVVLSSLEEGARKEVDGLAEQAATRKKERPATTPALTMRDAGRSAPATNIFYQGDFTQPREEVAPGFLSALDPNPARIEAPKDLDSTGRRSALASWIASPQNPLTARVIVNRLWHHHFGRGLVATPNDFGFGGVRPSHPELLDALASELIAGGWRLKRIHRLILLSQAYRQSSFEHPTGRKADVENILLWRQNPRRLDAEATRDAFLAVSGALLKKDGGPPVWPPVPQHLLDAQPGILETKSDKAAKDRLQGWFSSPAEEVDVRSIYLVQKRALAVPFLQPFDTPDMNVSCGRRDVTTVAPQALQLLNSPFAERMARTFGARVEREAKEDPVARAVRLALGRAPSVKELRILGGLPTLADACRAILNLNEFVYVD